MITEKNRVKYLAIFETWRNGNKKHAAKLVKQLTKKQLVEVLIRPHDYAGSYLTGDSIEIKNLRWGWEDFIELVFNRIYD